MGKHKGVQTLTKKERIKYVTENYDDICSVLDEVPRNANGWTIDNDIVLLKSFISGISWKKIKDETKKTSISSCRNRLELILNYIQSPIQNYRRGAELDRCSYADDCLKCTLPACIEDGYDPKRDLTNPNHLFNDDEWTDKEFDILSRLKSCYGVDILANILNRKTEDVENKLKEFNK